MSRRIPGIINCVVLAAVLFPVGVASQTTQPTERSPTQGLKETERFIKAGAAITQKVAIAKTQTQTALDAYNALVTQPSKDMKADYKRLMKAKDAMDAKVAEARGKLGELQQMGETYFSGRAETIKGIQDKDLQSRAQVRLQDNQKAFAGVLDGLQQAGAAVDPVRQQLDDQIIYLGSDLSPSGTASLKPNAEKLNQQGHEVFSKIDEAVKRADLYFQSMKASAG